MSLSSILYQSARNRFNRPVISRPVTTQIVAEPFQKALFTGYNPKTDMQIFRNNRGENVEAVNNNQGRVFQSHQVSSIIYQGNVVG